MNIELLLDKDYSNTIISQLDLCYQIEYTTAVKQLEKNGKLQSKTKKIILTHLKTLYADVVLIAGNKHGKVPSISFGNKKDVPDFIHNVKGRVADDAAYFHFEFALQLQKYKHNDYAKRIMVAKRLKLISFIEYKVYQGKHDGNKRANIMKELGIDSYTYNAILFQVDDVVRKMMAELKRFEKNKKIKIERKYLAVYKDSYLKKNISRTSENFIDSTTEINKNDYEELIVIRNRIKNETLEEHELKMDGYSIKTIDSNCNNEELSKRKRKYRIDFEKNNENSESMFSFAWEEYKITDIADEFEIDKLSKHYLKKQYYENHTRKEYDDWRNRTNRVLGRNLTHSQREQIEEDDDLAVDDKIMIPESYGIKAKRRITLKKDGEWVEGWYFYIKDTDKHCLISSDCSATFEINPNTIRKCSGRKDNNGNLIYVGDVLTGTGYDRETCEYYAKPYSYYVQIYYDEDKCAIRIRHLDFEEEEFDFDELEYDTVIIGTMDDEELLKEIYGINDESEETNKNNCELFD